MPVVAEKKNYRKITERAYLSEQGHAGPGPNTGAGEKGEANALSDWY